MTQAEWTPDAVLDLANIVDYIAEEAGRQSVARKVYFGIKETCNNYASQFGAGHVLGTERPELGVGIRSVTYKRWVILFRPVRNTVQVVAVVDGSRDYDKLF